MKVGAWGVCTRLRVSAVTIDPAVQCAEPGGVGHRLCSGAHSASLLQNNTDVVGPSTWVRSRACCSLPVSPGLTRLPPFPQCTSKMSGFALKFVENTTGVNQFVRALASRCYRGRTRCSRPAFPQPTVSDDATLLGLNSEGAISILTAGATSALWLHVVGTPASLRRHAVRPC